MLSKIPANVKPVIAVVGLLLAAVLLWSALRSKPLVDSPIILNIESGRVQQMSYNAYSSQIGKQGNNIRLFPLEPTGDGGLQLHRRFQGEDALQTIADLYRMPMDSFLKYFDNTNTRRPQLKPEFVPSWARSLEAPSQSAPPAQARDGQQSDR